MSSKKPNLLYFIKSHKHVKVGITSDPAKRIKSLQTGCPTPCYFLAIFDCGDKAIAFEYKLHQIFNEFHSHGEWFHCDKKIDDFIKESLEFESLRHNMWEETFRSVYYGIGDEMGNHDGLIYMNPAHYLSEIKKYNDKNRRNS